MTSATNSRAYAPRSPVKLAQSTGRYAMITTRWVDRDGSSLTTVRTLATVGAPALAALDYALDTDPPIPDLVTLDMPSA